MKISKTQLQQIIQEELTVVLNESPFPKLPSPSSEPKPINIKRVFNAEGDVLDREAGAAITAHTIRLLAATGGGFSLAAAAERGDPIEVTVDVDGKALAAQVAKSHSSQGKW